MGSYTTNLKFYKPAPTEFVDPEIQLNRNWDIADEAVRRCLEYEYTPLAVPDVSDTVVPRARFYKPYSNSVPTYFTSSSTWYQDPAAKVHTWNPAAHFLTEDWFPHPDLPLAYRVVKTSSSSTTEIEWIGSFYMLGGTLDLNINNTVMSAGAIDEVARPATNKYFNMWGGNTATDYSIARVLIGTDGSMQMKRYGANPAGGSGENRIELTGIKYCVEVTG